jgi:hypothetical protein
MLYFVNVCNICSRCWMNISDNSEEVGSPIPNPSDCVSYVVFEIVLLYNSINE